MPRACLRIGRGVWGSGLGAEMPTSDHGLTKHGFRPSPPKSAGLEPSLPAIGCNARTTLRSPSVLGLLCLHDTRRPDGPLDERDHFGGAIRTGHVLDDLAVANDEPLEQGAEQLAARAGSTPLPHIADALDVQGAPGRQRTPELGGTSRRPDGVR